LYNNQSVLINFAGTGNVIGALTDTPGTAGGNVIAAALYGIFIVGTSGTEIQGNLIGTDPTGTIALPIFYSGIVIQGGSNTIGGVDPRAGNVIASARTRGAINLQGDGTLVQHNIIGPDITGGAPLGDGQGGTYVGGAGIQVSSSDNVIQRNVIAFNGVYLEEDDSPSGGGILVRSGARNRISENSIYSNLGLGIELQNGESADGIPLPNDEGDGDEGPNRLQNSPVITSVIEEPNDVIRIIGTIRSTPNTVFHLEFFASRVGDPSGSGEGQAFVGSTDSVKTDANGFASFSETFDQPLSIYTVFTATATDPDGNTSEFSATFPPTIVPASSDVGVVLSDAPDPVTAGANLTYTIGVTNAGPDAASGVQVRFSIPAGTTFVSVAAPQGWLATAPAVGGIGDVVVSIVSLGVNTGNPAQITVVVRLNSGSASGAVVNAMATVTRETADPNSNNDTSTTTTVVQATAPPTVVDVRRFGFHRQHTLVVVRFSGAIDPATALSTAGYGVVLAGRDGVFGTRDDQLIRARAVAYNVNTYELTMRMAKSFTLFKPARFVILDGAIRELGGRVLDGDGDRVAGGAFVSTLDRASLVGRAVDAPGAAEVGLHVPRAAKIRLVKRPAAR
jgi:uncharacterized repeat protein (TIGR01451 family)